MFEQLPMILKGTWETLYITLISTGMAYVIGLPLGIVLVLTGPNGLRPIRALHSVLNVVVNVIRSVPFLILLIAVIPITRFIVGTSIGSKATIVPLVIAAFPFVARLVESSLNEVDAGIIEAMQSMGASNLQIATRAMLPEALPSLVTNAATATTTILGYSAMAGIVGGGGLGKIAIDYGFYRGDTQIMVMAVIALVLVVQILQAIGNYAALKVDKRKN